MCIELRKESNQKLFKKLTQMIEDYYSTIRITVKEDKVKSKLSSTLITKILMGTMGCIPAYDRYFTDGVKSLNVASGTYNIKSLLKLADFYEENNAVLEQARSKMDLGGLQYPQMKVLDMGFWKIGFDNDSKKGITRAY